MPASLTAIAKCQWLQRAACELHADLVLGQPRKAVAASYSVDRCCHVAHGPALRGIERKACRARSTRLANDEVALVPEVLLCHRPAKLVQRMRRMRDENE